MKRILLSLLIVCAAVSTYGQNTSFDNLNAHPFTNKSITWTSSNYGNGFGHRIINEDPGGYTLLNFEGRNNSSTWTNIMSMTSGGNIGIGTNSPFTRLHVYNGSSGNSPHGFSDFSVEDDENVLMTLMTQNNKYAYYGFADSDDDFVGGIQYNHANDMMYFRVNDRSADMVIANSGRVGIGKTSPAAELDVEGGVRSSDGNDNVTLRSSNVNNYSEIIWGDDTNDRFRFYYNYWNGTSGDKEVMSLLPSGNVGIGTTIPDSKLTVKGDIHAEEVKVDLSVPGPDYVFDKDYDLKSLEEVQNYIKTNGHLPNIPSAKTMAENGIQLGEMNMKLLEKIEELTLYTLEQQSTIQYLIKEINLLKEENENLE